MYNLIRLKRLRRGQAIVEFAFVLPLLLILSMLTIQYGIIYRTAIGLTNLSREGARYAATKPALDADTTKRVKDSMPPGLSYSDITVEFDPVQGDATRVKGSGGQITVKITYDMSRKLFLPATFLGVQVFATTYVSQATFAIQ